LLEEAARLEPALGQATPAFVLLAGDIGLGGLALGVYGIELLEASLPVILSPARHPSLVRAGWAGLASRCFRVPWAPEDVGGVWGYQEFLEALADPAHERHDEFMDWRGPFDPEAFDSVKATKKLKRGLPALRIDLGALGILDAVLHDTIHRLDRDAQLLGYILARAGNHPSAAESNRIKQDRVPR
jgi:hypothetical protein